MAKGRRTTDEPREASELQKCERPRCGYVVYGDAKNKDEVVRSKELLADHERQHTDPQGWMEDAAKAAKAEGKG